MDVAGPNGTVTAMILKYLTNSRDETVNIDVGMTIIIVHSRQINMNEGYYVFFFSLHIQRSSAYCDGL